MWLERSPGNGSGMVFQIWNRGLDPQEQALRTNSVKHRIEKTSETSLRVLLASLKQHVILSVDVGSLSRENIGSGTTGLYVYIGSLAEGMVRVYRQVFRPSSHTKCRVEKRRITWDRSVKRHAADEQLVRYYCSAHRYTEVSHIDIAGPVEQNILTTDGEVERYKDLALKSKIIHSHEIDSTTHRDWYTISKNEKGLLLEVWSLPNSFGWAQLLTILGTYHILRKALCL